MVKIAYLSPEIFLFLGGITVLGAALFGLRPKMVNAIVLSIVCFALWLLAHTLHVSTSAFGGLLHSGGFEGFFRMLFLLSTFLIVLLSADYEPLEDKQRPEYYFLILSMAASMMLAVSSVNLLMIYLSIEAVSLISYILIAFLKKDHFSSEAGVKYFVYGALSTGIMLYGMSLFYGLFRTFDLGLMGLLWHQGATNTPIFVMACVFILTGFAFKCSLVPFHMAAVDAYQGAPTPISAFLSIGPKAMGFALLIKFFMPLQSASIAQWGMLTQVLSIVTMTAANIIALRQTNIKRLLAYSSIAHAGFMLIALSALSPMGLKALYYYLFIYIFMNVGAFGGVIFATKEEIEQYAGLGRKKPLAAFMMTISLLSLAGLPPLAGFMAKFVIIAAAVQSRLYLLAVIAVLNSVVAAFYYLRVIKTMYIDDGAEGDRSLEKRGTVPIFLMTALILALLANLFLGIVPLVCLF